MANTLIRLLQLKYGLLSSTHLTKIEMADDETLLQWSERVLTAGTLEEVFKVEGS